MTLNGQKIGDPWNYTPKCLDKKIRGASSRAVAQILLK